MNLDLIELLGNRRPSRREVLKSAAALPVVGVLLSQTGCSTSEASLVEALITGISGIADIVEPQFAPFINSYANSATTFVAAYVAIRASGDTTAQQITAIGQAALAAALPNLPAGISAATVAKLKAIASLITELTDTITAISKMIEQTPGGANAFFATPKGKKIKPMDAKQRTKANADIAKLKAKLAQKK